MMILQPGLTKEGFWNGMMDKYPNATKEFCDWIDKYKEEVFWNTLFNGGISESQGHGEPIITSVAPKYHDLPYAMQLGIFLTYMNRFEDADDTIQELTKERSFIDDLQGMIDCFFSIREEEVKISNELWDTINKEFASLIEESGITEENKLEDWAVERYKAIDAFIMKKYQITKVIDKEKK